MDPLFPCRVVHLNLDAPLPELPDAPHLKGWYVVFWSGGNPIGHIQLQKTEVDPSVGLKEAILKLRAANWPEPENPEIFGATSRSARVSVAICTHERPDSLRRLLDSLFQLEDKPWEIIVVDNAPRTARTMLAAAAYPGVRYLLEPQAGLNVARNVALRNGSGDIIAFADDDVVVHPRWIAGIRRGFADPRVMAVTGLVLPAELETQSQALFEAYWSFNRGYQPRVFEPSFVTQPAVQRAQVADIGAGANMAFRRDVREKVGLFDERLDAGAAGCNGDSEFWYRILARGWHCRYEPTAVVHHHHRREMAALKRQLHHYMRGHVAALLVQFERHHHWHNLRRMFWAIPRDYWRKIVSRRRNVSTARRETLRAEIMGCLAGPFAYLFYTLRQARSGRSGS